MPTAREGQANQSSKVMRQITDFWDRVQIPSQSDESLSDLEGICTLSQKSITTCDRKHGYGSVTHTILTNELKYKYSEFKETQNKTIGGRVTCTKCNQQLEEGL